MEEECLAGRQIQLPAAHEAFVEAEGEHLPAVGEEALAPLAQGLGVMGGEVVEVVDDQPAGGGHRSLQGAQARQVAAREDMLADPVGAVAVAVVELVRDGDHLHRRPPLGREQALAGGEEVTEIAVADRLEHLDRHDGVVAAARVAVVLEADVGSAGEADPRQTVAGEARLGRRQGQAGDVAAELRGSDLGEAAPATADLEHPHPRRQAGQGGEAQVLPALRLGQVTATSVEHRRRVGHRLVQEQPVELVRQVVVGGDIASRAGAGVGAEEVPEPLDGPSRHAEKTVVGELPLVGEEDAEQADQVGARPLAGGVGFAQADVGASQEPSETGPVVHREDRARAARALAKAAHRTVREVELQSAVADPLESGENQARGEAE